MLFEVILHVLEWMAYILAVLDVLLTPITNVRFINRQYEDISPLTLNNTVQHFSIVCHTNLVQNGEIWQYHVQGLNTITGASVSFLEPSKAKAVADCIKRLSEKQTRNEFKTDSKVWDDENQMFNTTNFLDYNEDMSGNKCIINAICQELNSTNGREIKCDCTDSCTAETDTATTNDKRSAEELCKDKLQTKRNHLIRHKI